MTRPIAFLVAALSLGACVAAPPPPVVIDPAPVVAPVTAAVATPVAVTGVAGLQSREPDACHAGNYRSSIGQPGTVIPQLGITRSYRVVEYRGIEPQEYDSLRIVFRLDAAGNIQSVDCG